MTATLGIDLASRAKKTAVCEVNWVDGHALPAPPRSGVDDDELLELMDRADWVGIDAPFGWPDAMVEAIHGFANGRPWPTDGVPERLRYRTTDWHVHDLVAQERDTSVWPLSVAADKIAVCAWRCANLLSRHAERTGRPIDRIGVPGGAPSPASDAGLVAPFGIVEVYPAGALALWALPYRRYKTTPSIPAAAARAARGEIIGLLRRDAGSWLVVSEAVEHACLENDDHLDALLCALVAYAAATRRTLPPEGHRRKTAQREGWIHLPAPDCILDLGATSGSAPE